MIAKFALRMVREVDPRLLWKFSYNFGWKGMRAVQKFEARKRRGEHFPAFLFLSVTDRCNLSCQGCWVTQASPAREMAVETLDNIIRECKARGSHFFGLLGGEPLLHKGLFELLGKHPDCYFLLFTNGTLITSETAQTMRRLGNVSPLISIEGLETVSDERRGGRNVYGRALDGLAHCHANRLVTGVATSVCKSNFDDLANEAFVREIAARGAHYCWYYIYRPVGPNPTPALALDNEQVRALRQFMVDIRPRAPLMVVDAYWDHDGNALCPAAVGIGHHVGPGGDIEPCPPIQLADRNVGDGAGLGAAVAESPFLARFREEIAEKTRGCVLLEDPALLSEIAKNTGAYDSTGRDAAFEELARMHPCGSHHQPGLEIPEKSFLYRFAKKHWFFGFGAYG